MTILISAAQVYADTAWKDVASDINCREFNCAALDPGRPDVVYVGTSNGAYKTEDGGESWERVFAGWDKRKNIRHIFVKGGEVFLCTDKGLFISRDEGKSWSGSSGIASRAQAFSAAVIDEGAPAVLVATNEGLFKSPKDKKEWQRVFFTGEEDAEAEDEEGAEIDLPKVRAVIASIHRPSRIYLGTEDGVYVRDGEGAPFVRLSDAGLLDKETLFLAESPLETDRLYAVTNGGIFYFCDGWQRLESAAPLRDARSIAFGPDRKNSVWITAKRGVYKSIDTDTDEKRIEIETSNLLKFFRDEPAINEVQERAIRYAEVHPSKIANWRARANMSAVLPRLSFGIDRDRSQSLHWDSGANPDMWVIGPEEEDMGWDITLSWDLGDLIWNGDQTLIDVRSKLMVQLRDDILDEVNSYYFERRRLQIELLESPPQDKRERIKKELRIQELTANLDALTGGYFSRGLRKDER